MEPRPPPAGRGSKPPAVRPFSGMGEGEREPPFPHTEVLPAVSGNDGILFLKCPRDSRVRLGSNFGLPAGMSAS